MAGPISSASLSALAASLSAEGGEAWVERGGIRPEWMKSGTSGGSRDGCSSVAMAAGTQVPSGAPPSEKGKVRRRKHLGGFGDAGSVVGNYRSGSRQMGIISVGVGVFTQKPSL